jgi:glyoxylate reductase
VLVARRLPSAGTEALGTDYEVREGGRDASPPLLHDLARGVDAIVADPTVVVDDALLEAAGPRLRVVANFAVGYDNVDLEGCRRRGIVVTNTPDVLTDATAELALMLTVGAARRTTEAEADLRGGDWAGPAPDAYLGLGLTGATFGVVGMGRIGTRYSELVRAMAGELLYTSRTSKHEAERKLGAARVGLDEILRRADVVSLHLPVTDRTAGLVGQDELRSMQAHSILVNTSRGRLVDEEALAEALRSGEIGGAGLDVYAHEPRVPDGLLEAPHCVLLPHIGSATTQARDAMARLVAENVLAALAGDEPPNRVV